MVPEPTVSSGLGTYFRDSYQTSQVRELVQAKKERLSFELTSKAKTGSFYLKAEKEKKKEEIKPVEER